MKCKHCGYETNSNKIFFAHEKSCLKIQEENGLNNSDSKSPKDDKQGVEALDWNALKKYAVEKGIDVKGKKKEDILQALKDLETGSKASDNPGGGKNDNNTGEG